MYVAGFVGSPRKDGNTEILVNEILSGAAEKGAETKLFRLSTLNIKPCQACRYCKSHEECIIHDDMQMLYQEIRRADALVIGSPIYIGQMTAQTKLFVDRFYAFIRPDFSYRLDRKKMILAFTQGQKDTDVFRPYIDLTAKMFEHRFDVNNVIIVGGTGAITAGGTGARDDIKAQQGVMNNARTIGRTLGETPVR